MTYRLLVRPVEILQQIFHCETNRIEAAFVLTILSTVALVVNRGWREWLGVLAVWMTWHHASVANRLEESEEKRSTRGEEVVHCRHRLQQYFYCKEVLWIAYFLLIGAYSALIGCGVFLAYGPWRQLWRRYHPA